MDNQRAIITMTKELKTFILNTGNGNVALLNPLVKKMRNPILFSAFLDAVNIASIAIIIAVCYVMYKMKSRIATVIGPVDVSLQF